MTDKEFIAELRRRGFNVEEPVHWKLRIKQTWSNLWFVRMLKRVFRRKK